MFTLQMRKLGFAVAAIVVMVGSFAQAADGTWNGITGNWSDNTTPGGVWTNGIPADGADFTANFTGINITATKTNTLDSNRTIGNITFTDATTASHDLTINGANVLTLDRTDATKPTINVISRTLTISSKISGSDGLQKIGAGTLSLSGNNDYTGTTAINTGVVIIAHANALGTTAGNTTIACTGLTSTGGRLQFSSGSGNPITVAENITITGNSNGGTSAINNSGQATVTLSGNIILSSLTGGIRLDTNNSGSNMILAGIITQTESSQALIFNTNSTGGQNIVVNNPIALNGGTLQIQGTGFSVVKGVNATDGTGIGQTTIVSGGTLRLGVTNALNTTANLTVDGTFNLNNFSQTVNALIGAATGILQNGIAGTKTLTVGNGGGSGTFSGVIQTGTGQIALIKTGAGSQTLTGVNTYSGATLINEGTLVGVVGGSCANSAVTNASAGTLAINVINDTNQWTCASLTLNNGSQLKFNFMGTPSSTNAPLKILGNLIFVGTPTIEVVPGTLGTYPLLTVAGTVPETVPTLAGDIGALQWIGKTLWVAPSGTAFFVR
jgi:fibronectin-binding autotransporter adhesin